MRERVPAAIDFYVIHYEAYLPSRDGHGERRPLAATVTVPHGEHCPPNAVAGPFATRHEAECVQREKRTEFLSRWYGG